MGRYRKKPVVIEAEQWPRIKDAPGVGQPDSLGVVHLYDCDGHLCGGLIETLEGRHEVKPGDWIIVGVKDEEKKQRTKRHGRQT